MNVRPLQPPVRLPFHVDMSHGDFVLSPLLYYTQTYNFIRKLTHRSIGIPLCALAAIVQSVFAHISLNVFECLWSSANSKCIRCFKVRPVGM